RWEGSTFPEPPGIVRVEVDPESGGAATWSCPTRVEEVFAAGTEPPPRTLHANVFKRWWDRMFHPDRPKTQTRRGRRPYLGCACDPGDSVTGGGFRRSS